MKTQLLGPEELRTAVDLLAAGRLVAIPTETVYGLAAAADRPDALRAVFEAKGRPAGHPLILHLAAASEVSRWAVADERAGALAAAFWPGPLTMVVPRTDAVDDVVTGGRATVGVRVPDHDLTRRLLVALGTAVAAPSANRFGAVSPTEAAHVVSDLDGRIAAVLDGGPCRVGVESTIVELLPGEPPTLLRPGGISEVELEAVLGTAVVDGRGGAPRAAGMLVSHYAPAARVVIAEPDDLADVEVTPDGTTGWIVPEAVGGDVGEPAIVLPDNAAGYAAGLYRALRDLDRLGVDRIVAVPPTVGPMVAAVRDRLDKAAGPR